MLQLTIDGRVVVAHQGETILDVARREGIRIPALCHLEGMAAWGGCRLCLVEIEGMAKLQTACTTWATPGMVVRTDTARVRSKRETYLKMYLSDHNAYCEAPCSHACPADVDIPAFLAAVAAGDFDRALAIVQEELPFPGILGRLCSGLCEAVCRRREVDEPIAICALHRALADRVTDAVHAPRSRLSSAPLSGKKVAVIGAGASGLSASWFLRKQGHEVTIFDQQPEPGGSLRYLVPEFRLPQAVLERELTLLWANGVRFVGRSEHGHTRAAENLLAAGFDAVIVATEEEPVLGADTRYRAAELTKAAAKVIQGVDILADQGALISAKEFLCRARLGNVPPLQDTVAVVGNSSETLDAARTALRRGASEVVVITTEGRDAGSSFPEQLRNEALQEGVRFVLAAKITAQNNDGALTLVCLGTSPTDQESKRRTRASKTSAEDRAPGVQQGEQAAPGVSFSVSLVILATKHSLASRRKPPWKANPFTGRTDRQGIFLAARPAEAKGPDQSEGGADKIEDPVVYAVARGKRVALAVDGWLKGEELVSLEDKLERFSALPYLDQLSEMEDLGPLGQRLAQRSPVWLKMGIATETRPRVSISKTSKKARMTSPALEAEKTLELAAAKQEAQRCLQCVCPSVGKCELQRLAVEHSITSNELVTRGGRVRIVEPQLEHPFIKRDMQRCIACGRCVRVCRDVAGPACYDFTGRGFTIKVDTAYSDPLQLAKCISCGRCVTVCPTGALTFNERALLSFSVDERRCIMCGQCVDVCPVEALAKTDRFEEARTRWLELVDKGSRLAPGHRMCAGCGAPVVVRQVLMALDTPAVVGAATGCLEVSTTIYPYTSWKDSYIHTAFENVAATISGVETAYRALKKKGMIEDDFRFIAFGGDGGTYDIGLQALSGAMERGHRMLYVCYDNGAYMNTGFQRSGATPMCAWTTTSPVGKERAGKLQVRKNLTEIMIAHGLKYVAQASPHDPRDLVRKAAKALSVDGPTFLNILSPCPRGWRSEGAESIDLARQAVNTCYWPLFECEDGQYRLTYRPKQKQPVAPWLRRQGRFAHLFQPGQEQALAAFQEWVDQEWEKLLRKCQEPSEEEWQALQQTEPCA